MCFIDSLLRQPFFYDVLILFGQLLVVENTKGTDPTDYEAAHNMSGQYSFTAFSFHNEIAFHQSFSCEKVKYSAKPAKITLREFHFLITHFLILLINSSIFVVEVTAKLSDFISNQLRLSHNSFAKRFEWIVKEFFSDELTYGNLWIVSGSFHRDCSQFSIFKKHRKVLRTGNTTVSNVLKCIFFDWVGSFCEFHRLSFLSLHLFAMDVFIGSNFLSWYILITLWSIAIIWWAWIVLILWIITFTFAWIFFVIIKLRFFVNDINHNFSTNLPILSSNLNSWVNHFLFFFTVCGFWFTYSFGRRSQFSFFRSFNWFWSLR